MAEDEVQYASVVVKSKKSPRATTEEDIVYDEVKISNQKAQQTPETNGPLLDKAAEKCRRYQQLACCFGILCVLLVLSIIGVCVYLATVRESTGNELNELKSNLTRLNNKFTSDYENLKVQFNNLTATSTALENKITTLTAENQDLRREKKNLTEQIETMEKTWNEQNVSRAQWSIDEYCPKGNKGRSCTSCQKGWGKQFSSCYAYNDAKESDQRNWEGAREDCSTKNSDLTVVFDQIEKDYVKTQSPVIEGIQGYWIGLKAEGGKWKWIDGSELTNQAWIQQQPAVDGQCVTSLQGREWRSESCDEKNAWICEKKALSV
ncbi:C-type lectin domain family 10 member A-like isoform X1 [Fundulus heteroclitus]|uniref:C-type lectin domain family 10 member A-like isoform X1 n=1 Tax=Fundulus heteroclitus TaxID=8078 RepID=UPI00165A2C8E|nr:C-type lectin domain family 10 member A-like isoform X1 [Fundulus heteroclitus]